MIRTTIIFALTVMLTVPITAQDKLSREQQLEIIQHYLLATGQSDALAAFSITAEEIAMPELPIKCGTPAVMDFVVNRDKLDDDLKKSLGSLLYDRPLGLNDTVSSPSGRFLIHYTTTGSDAVYNGFPGYADSVAKIFDEVYAFLIDTLNYPDPPSDENCPNGGTAAFDVYLYDLNPTAYGYTYPESDCPTSNRTVPTFMALENDYQEDVFPSAYRSNPLLAVRVTCAHEFFHAVQFGIDATEGAESPDGYWHSYWMEMSATWMEEEKYDHINDYYNYLPHFFREPEASIQRFLGSFDLHPYASMLYPLFLAQRYDRDLIRQIWLRCAQLGIWQDNFPQAANDVIGTFSGGQETFASSLHEFTLWNYFTGSRALLAPAGIGYEERGSYAKFELGSDIKVENNYADSIVVDGEDNLFSPQHNAAFYLMLDNIQSLEPDTTYWVCSVGSFPTCSDSTQVTETENWEIMHIDSSFSVGFSLDHDFPYNWGFNIIYHQVGSDDINIDETTLPNGSNDLFDFNHVDLDAMVFVLSPASSVANLFSYVNTVPSVFNVGYRIGVGHAAVSSSSFISYPNPAIADELSGGSVNFQFQVPSDAIVSEPVLYVDIFTVAGERVRSMKTDTYCGSPCEVEWNLKNDGGELVASGVYVAYGRICDGGGCASLIAEGRTKVLVVR